MLSIFTWKSLFSYSWSFRQSYGYFSLQSRPWKCQLTVPNPAWVTIQRGWLHLSEPWMWCTSARGSESTDPPVTHMSPIRFPTSMRLGRNAHPASKKDSTYFYSPPHLRAQYVLLVSRWFCWRGLSGCALPRLDCPDSVGWAMLCCDPVVMGDWSLSLSQEDSLPPAKQGTNNHKCHTLFFKRHIAWLAMS